MKQQINIRSGASISALGMSKEVIWQKYCQGKALFSKNGKYWVSQLFSAEQRKIAELKAENSMYRKLDKTVLMAILSARKAIEKAGWAATDFGVNIGSSRGATELFEKYHQEFITTGKVATLASPTTTLGNISSWVMQDLGNRGPEFSHSITCSTALHAVLNAIAWIESGMAERFVAGGSEAPLTPFTLAQMKALKLYAKTPLEEKYPNRSMDFSKTENTMILGEAAACFTLEKGNAEAPKIVGYGYGSEKLTHNVSISSDALCLQQSMKMALQKANLTTVDVVVLHAPGTIQGDVSELNALKKVFSEKMPRLTSNKFMIGHTFGASGAMSLEMALLMLEHQVFIENPHYQYAKNKDSLKTILVNAVGFGGNAVSLILSK